MRLVLRKQILSVKLQVFKKSGLVKEDPLNEPFDPNRHNAVFQIPDASKPEGTIAHVLKVLNYKSTALFLALMTLSICYLLQICNLLVMVCFHICSLDTRCLIEL